MRVLISKINHHPLNERIYSLSGIESLIDSINQVGLLEPLTIDQNFQVVSGNRRFEAVKRLKWKYVEVHQIHVNKGEDVLTLIHFNRQRIKTHKELLNEYFELEDYHKKKGLKKGQKVRNVVSSSLNAKDGQLARLLYIFKRNPEYIDLIDKGILTINQGYLNLRREEVEKKSQLENKNSSPLNFTKKDLFKFYQQSSEKMGQISNSSCDLVLCSPPFWTLRSYSKNDILGSETTSEEYVQNIVNHLSEEVLRIMKPTSSFFIEIGDTFLNGNLQNIPHRVAIEFQKRGFIQRNSIVVNRKNPKPSSSKTNLTPSYSMLFHFVKTMEYHYQLSLTKTGENNKPSLPPRHRNSKGIISNSVSPYIPNPDGKNMGDFFTEDIVRVAVSNQKYSVDVQHPARFPEQLVHLVLNSVVYLPFTNKPGISPLVVDPFCGGLGTWYGIKWFNENLGTKIRFVGYDIKKWF
jgi:hypothetical protein